MFFYTSVGQEEISPSGTSYLNRCDVHDASRHANCAQHGGEQR